MITKISKCQLMITTKINIKPHLAEYFSSIEKYGVFENGKFMYVHFPHKLDVYQVIWDLMEKRPDNCSGKDVGNFCIALPNRKEGKDPRYYNYLGERSIDIIERRLETMFFADSRSMFEENKQKLGIAYLDSAHLFLCKYQIESITPDALIKDEKRYRDNVLKRNRIKRKYTKKEEKNF